VAKDKIRHFLFLNGRWRWRPTKKMRELGFRLVSMGRGYLVEGERLASVEDRQRAIALNDEWDLVRTGRAGAPRPQYPPGSIGEAYTRIMKIREADRKAKGIVWTKEQESRDDWPRAWKWIGKFFATVNPRTVQAEHLIGDVDRNVDGLYQIVLREVSRTEAHRVVKVWRALWKRMGVLGYCDPARDPSLTFTNSAPDPRSTIVDEGFVVRIVKRAIREKYLGLAAACAYAWDSQLSPVDVRKTTAGKRGKDAVGTLFGIDRSKTGRPAIATLGPRAARLLDEYLAAQFGGQTLHPSTRIFRDRFGKVFTKDSLGDEFRAIRTLVFGKNDERQLADFRRTGTIEALAGGATDGAIANKMANNFNSSSKLKRTYGPANSAIARQVDQDRLRGRRILREQKAEESVTGAGQAVSPAAHKTKPSH
jgi:hypothetical protein